MIPRDIIGQFDAYLADRRIHLDGVVIGGTALALLGVISRQTKDCDILDPALSDDLLRLSRTFAADLRQRGEMLQDDWLNNGPASLTDLLPSGWRDRLRVVFEGNAIVFRTLGRDDLLKTKLYALCDRGLDIGDCLALEPTAAEIRNASPWLERQDLNPDWPAHVRETLADLGRRLGHGL